MTLAPRLSVRDTAGLVADVFAPLLARGVIVRRPPVENVVDRLDGDARAVKRMQRLRDAHGPGPVRLALPGREMAVVLAPGDVTRVLEETPEPFTPATVEKRAALSKFQPHGVLISKGAERSDRRRFNEDVLDTPRPVHRFGDELAAKIHEEADALLAQAERTGMLDWDAYAIAFWRIVRRVTLGDGAREDHELTDMLRRLRGDANWSYLMPQRRKLRERFLRRLSSHLDRAEPGSLAALVRALPASDVTDPDQQVPQWLFAFDAVGMASFRALALLATHPESGDTRDDAYRRAAMLESIRLWPTTPAILRDTTAETRWESGTLRTGTGIVLFAPFFHRDNARFDHADTFAPQLWHGTDATTDWPLIPFSGGPGECPGRNVVQLVASTLLGRLLERHTFRTDALDPAKPLPGTLSPFRLRFAVG